jgi:hypothetical protein
MIEKDKLLLARYLSEIKFKKYSLGEFDCCLFIFDWINKLTQVDWSKDIRGNYNDQRSMFRFAKKVNPPLMMTGKYRPDKWDNPGYKEISREELPKTGDIWWGNNKTHYTGFIIFQGLAWCVIKEHDGIFKHLLEDVEDDYSPIGYTKRFRRI